MTLNSITASSFRPLRGQHGVEGLGLGDGAGKAVEDEAALGIRLFDPVGDDADDDVVGDKIAPIHDLLGLDADGRPGRHRCTEHVAGRELGYAQPLDQAHGLRALSGPRRSQQNNPHRRPPDFVETSRLLARRQFISAGARP